ncbi:hypothetical protein WAC45_27440, partial [Klebsiella pneumoniae]|uniref:hypothetical protein n=1 Tax=Klebsiella pneumoniae TaxID=573 RepID=UPI0030130BE6
KSGSSPQIVEYAKIDVNTVIERGLLSIPPESLLHALDSYIAEIEDIVNSIEHLHPITLYEDETEPGETFAHPRIIIKKATIIYA